MDFINSILAPLNYAVSWILVQFHKVFGAMFGETSGVAWSLSIVAASWRAPGGG